MKAVTKKQNLVTSSILIILIVALIFTIGMVSVPASALEVNENEEGYFIGQETVSNLNSVVKNNSPSESAPVMTVLTHGLGESAYAWSGTDGIFGYDTDSVIEQLAGDRNANNTIVFWAGVKGKPSDTTYDFLLKEQTTNRYFVDDSANYNNRTELSMQDVSKHIILVFEGRQGEFSLQGNSDAYEELRYVINKVLYDLKFWGALNPRINLIGHGRGGILNLMYAAEYKFNVASMYSIGTPYSGSTSLDLMQTALGDGSSIIHNYINSLGANDIQTYASQNLANWNTIKGYVDTHALGSAMRVDFLKGVSGILSDVLSVLNQIDGLTSTQDLINLAKQNDKIMGMPGERLNHIISLLEMAEKINVAYSVIDIFDIMAQYRQELNNYFVEELNDQVQQMVRSNFGMLLVVGLSLGEDFSTELFLGDIIYVLSLVSSLNETYESFVDQFPNLTYELYYGHEEENINNKNTVPIVSTAFFNELLDIIGNDFSLNFMYKDDYGNVVSFGIEDIFKSDGVDFDKLKGLIYSLIPAIEDFLTQNTIDSLDSLLQFLDIAAYVPGSHTVLTVVVDYLYATIIAPVLAVTDIVNFDWELTKSQIGIQAIVMLNTEIVRKNYLGNTGFLQKVQLWNDDFVWLNDGFVNSSSQLAESFDGINSRLFLHESVSDNTYKPSLPQLPIPLPHNFQTKDWDIVKYIVDDIKLGNVVFSDTYRIIDGETAELVRISNYTKTLSTVAIPETYEDFSVVSVARNAFSALGTSNLTSIILPNSIKTIGKQAFAGNDNLTTINIPANLEMIGDEAFLDCHSLQNIIIPATTYSIGKNAFTGCVNLNITVSSENVVYKAQDNILYNDDYSRIVFAGNVATNIVLSNTVTTIDSFAFYKSNVESINLSNTLTIGDSAFAESNLSTVNGGLNLLSVGMQTFESTPWLNGSHVNGMAVVGNTLVKYKGSASDISAGLFPSGVTAIGSGAFYESEVSSIELPDAITRIGDYAFSYSDNLTEIVFSKFIDAIGGYAFRGCTSLTDVKFYRLNTPAIGINAFDGNAGGRNIFVPFGYENAYKSYSSLAKYSASIETLEVTINYISNGQPFSSTSLPYYGTFANMPLPVRDGYTFEGWYLSDDPEELSMYQNGSICDLKNETNLYARWSPVTYTISYTLNGGTSVENPSSYTIEAETFALNAPSRIGYSFAGWFTNAEFSGEAVTLIEQGSTGNKEFFAKWTANTYTLIFDANGGEALNPNTKTVTYNSEVETLPIPVRAGYTFIGWNSLANGNGVIYISSVIYTADEDLTIYAQWQIITYTISYTLNGGINASNPVSYNVETSTINLESPTRTGYSFAGWFTDAEFGGEIVTSIIQNSIGDKELFAKWTANEYMVTLDKNASNAILSTTTITVTYDNAFTLPVPTREGHVFEGWYDGTDLSVAVRYATEEGQSTKNWDKTSEWTLYAKWRTKVFALRLDNNTDDPIIRYLGPEGVTEFVQNITYGQNFDINGFINNIITNFMDLPAMLHSFWFYKGHKIAGLKLGTGVVFGWVGNNVPDLGADAETIDIYINWVKEQHTIKVYLDLESRMVNPNNPLQTITALYDEDISLAIPIKTGHTFNGYLKTIDEFFTEVPVLGIFDYTKMPDLTSYLIIDGTVEIYGSWTANTYTLTFDSNGGTAVNPSTKQVTYGSTINVPLIAPFPTPIRTGYTFNGWNTAQNGSGTTYGSLYTYNTAADTILYAQWTANTYTLNFNVNGGNQLSQSNKTVTYHSAVGTLPIATRMGYENTTAWNTAANGSGDAYTFATVYNIAGHTTIYAQWSDPITYTISYTLNGGSSVNNPTSYNVETETFSLISPTRTGYTFNGWFTNAGFTGSAVTSVTQGSTGNKQLYAKWTLTPYTITYDLNGGTSNHSSNPSTYTYGQQPSFQSPIRKYYKFNYWLLNGTTQLEIGEVLSSGQIGNITLKAIWYSTTVTNYTSSGTKSVSNYVHIATISASNMQFNIGNSVKEITFKGASSSTTYTSFYINILQRTANLTIRFVNIKLTGRNNLSLVNGQNCPNLTIDVEGTANVIKGGLITDNLDETTFVTALLIGLAKQIMLNRVAVISAKNLSITSIYSANAKLVVTGGNGSGAGNVSNPDARTMAAFGGNGVIAKGNLSISIKTLNVTGGNGAKGVTGFIGSTPGAPGKAAKGAYGTTGYRGGDGGTGACGGFGGLGIGVTGNLTVASGTTFTSVGGIGGIGGTGGKGGKGGTGGEGGDGVFFGATAKQGGRGGKGGDGGDGGAGGAGGTNVVQGSIINSGSYTLSNGQSGSGGTGGAKGAGGNGGLGGKKTTGGRAATGGTGPIGDNTGSPGGVLPLYGF